MLWYLPVQWQEQNLRRPMSRMCSALTTAPLETPTLTCDSTTSLKSRTREPPTLMIGANTYDNLQRWSGRRRSPLNSQRAGYGRSGIGQPSSNQHGDWYDQSSHCLASTFQFTSVYCRGSGAVSYSTTICFACFLPFACPSFLPAFLVLKRLRFQYESRFSLSHPSHRSRLSLNISLNTVRALSLSHMSLPFLDRATLPPKESRRRLRLDHAIRLDHPHRLRPPSACRATAGHRPRWRSRTRSI